MRKKITTVACLLMGILIYFISLSNQEIQERQGSSMYNIMSSEKQSKETFSNQEITYGQAAYSNNIIVKGKSDDLGVFKRPNFINNTYLFGRTHKDIDKDIHENSMEAVLTNIDKPLLMEFSPSGDKNFFRTNIFISPNDTIEFEVKNNKLTFAGKNAAQNNLYTELDSNTPKYAKSPYKGDLFLYKKKVKSIYEKKKEFLASYISQHNLSQEFINAFKKLLRFEYYDNLVSPRITPSTDGTFYFNDFNALPTLIKQEYANKEILFDSSKYFDDITVEDFKDDEAMRHTHFFKNSLIIYIRHYFIKTDATPFSKEYLIAEKEFIEANFEGDIKDYAIGRMIWDYYNKGFAYSSQNINFMVNLIDEYMTSVSSKETHITAMQEIRDDILMYDFKLSESALNAKMVNHLGDTITLRDIFNRSNKRIKVVDFWASWCPPCVKQIKENKPFKDRLSVENNVEWIYLSIDSDREKWLKKGEQLNETLHFRNSYLLVKGKKSSLAKALNVHQIPRYLIVDQKNKIVVNNAPSPANEDAFEKIIDAIKPNAELLTFNY